MITPWMESMQWLILLFLFGLYGVLVGVAVSVKRLAKSLEARECQDSSPAA